MRPEHLLQIRLELNWLAPPIWRRLIMPESITLKQFHKLILKAMGWSDKHLHEFIFADKHYGKAEPGSSILSENAQRLGQCLGTLKTFNYIYDFGDNWEFMLEVEKVHPMDAFERYPTCIDGARAAPPEDVGGPPGFMEFLEMVSNPHHPGHQDAIEWVEAKFDPEKFENPFAKTRK